MRVSVIAMSAVLLLVACSSKGDDEKAAPGAAGGTDKGATGGTAARATDRTPNQFYGGGTPTYVLGTVGDDRSDRAIAAQVDLIRGLVFPDAKVVGDTSIDIAKGPSAWPPNPVVYGGAHVNWLVTALASTLPLEIDARKLVLGDQTFAGEDYLLIALIPARPADGSGPGHPEFLLYAGTGTPGIAEINGISHGPDAILVADTFGLLVTGRWKSTADGALTAELGTRARRISWRTVEGTLPGAAGTHERYLSFQFPKQLEAAANEEQVIAACKRGLKTAVSRLEIADPTPISIYIYPDRGSKKSLTGDAGDGHAVVSARALHVIRSDPAPGGGLEKLMVHEGTHVLTYEAWSPAGTPFLGEGIAVWASGAYGGVPLAKWRSQVDQRAQTSTLLGPGFRKMPEKQSYPLAGLFVETAIEAVGLANVRDHLLGATAATWDAACKSAGTSPAALQKAFSKTLGN